MIIDNNTLDNKTIGVGRVLEIMSNQLENGITPKTITYKDIDTEMMEFISKEVPMLYVGKEIPTFFFTQQRLLQSDFPILAHCIPNSLKKENHPTTLLPYMQLSFLEFDYKNWVLWYYLPY